MGQKQFAPKGLYAPIAPRQGHSSSTSCPTIVFLPSGAASLTEELPNINHCIVGIPSVYIVMYLGHTIGHQVKRTYFPKNRYGPRENMGATAPYLEP